MKALRGPRPLRSVLYFAGEQPDDVASSEQYGSDAIMIDLEEPREPFPDDLRRQAGAQVGEYLRSLPPPSPRRPLYFCRIRGTHTGYTMQDLAAIMGPNLSGVFLPKVVSAAEVLKLDGMLHCFEVERGMEVGSTMIFPIMESTTAIRNAYKIARASKRVAYMGGAISRSGDLQQQLGYKWTAEGTESLFLRSKVLIDARSAGIRWPISGMWAGGLDDIDGLRTFATELRNLGYRGMLLNSASTSLVPYVHEAFTPSDDEVAQWQALLHAAAAADRSGDRILMGDRSQGEGYYIHGSQVKAARLNMEWARALAVRDGRQLPGD